MPPKNADEETGTFEALKLEDSLASVLDGRLLEYGNLDAELDESEFDFT